MALEIIEIGQEEIQIDMCKAEEVSEKLGVDIEFVERAYGIMSYYLKKPRGIVGSGRVPFSWELLEKLLTAAVDNGYCIEEVVETMENSMKDSDFMSVESFLVALEMEK